MRDYYTVKKKKETQLKQQVSINFSNELYLKETCYVYFVTQFFKYTGLLKYFYVKSALLIVFHSVAVCALSVSNVLYLQPSAHHCLEPIFGLVSGKAICASS